MCILQLLVNFLHLFCPNGFLALQSVLQCLAHLLQTRGDGGGDHVYDLGSRSRLQ